MTNILNDVSQRSQHVYEVIKNRRSVRQFKSQIVDEQHIKQIIEAGINAPSGSNSQNQRFLIITDEHEKKQLGYDRFVWPHSKGEKLRSKKPYGIIGNAPVVVVVYADASLNDHRNMGEYYIWEKLEMENCAASIQNMLLMATSLGLGSCWVSASQTMSRTRLLNDKSWAKILPQYDIPEWFKPQGIVLFGYPKSNYTESGYPKGEKMHGASIWAKTARKPYENYIIKQRVGHDHMLIEISTLGKLRLHFLSKVLALLIKLTKVIDKYIYSLEVEKALSKLYDSYKK